MSDSNATHLIDFVYSMRDPKNVAINIRVSEAEREAFQRAATLDDQSVSDWLRKLGKRRVEELGLTSQKQTRRTTK